MGFFDRWFGRRPPVTPKPSDDSVEDPTDEFDDDEIPSGDPPPIAGPPEFVRVAELQKAYWTPRPDELAREESRDIASLTWRETLRLHHLACLARVRDRSPRIEATLRRTTERLLAPESPYRPRPAVLWRGESASFDDREPDDAGELANASLTHLGCLEVYRLDEENRPVALDFVGFGEVATVAFAPPRLLRAAMLFRYDGPRENVFTPLLYGLTWTIGDEYARDGRITRFVASLDGLLPPPAASGLGVGQQDFHLRGEKGESLVGLGSLAQIAFPLDARDPRFDEQVRARRVDPDAARRRTTG